jgi:2'-5' RNA ligase
MAYTVGQSAVIVPVPAAEPIVGRWRARFDAAAALGVPAHLTVVYPFLPASSLTSSVLGQVRALVAAQPPMTITFAECGRFPGVLYLAPSPAEPVRALIHAFIAHWPEAPPYRGEFGDPIPHLTVAVAVDDPLIEQEVSAQLPFTTALSEAHLITFDGTHWTTAERLPFADA